jgi:Protein of unknown function (DUF1064)
MKTDKHKDKMSAAEFQEYLRKQEAGRNSKYGGIPTETRDGQKFQSHHEANYYNTLLLRKVAKEIVDFKRQVRFELIVNGVFICEYILDFEVLYPDGHVEHIDTKSTATLTPIYRLKKKLMKALYNIDIIDVFAPKK